MTDRIMYYIESQDIIFDKHFIFIATKLRKEYCLSNVAKSSALLNDKTITSI